MKRVALVLALVLLVTGCQPGKQPSPPGVMSAGDSTGTFDVEAAGMSITTHWVAHLTDPETARVVVVMHGVNRNAADYCATWQALTSGRNVLVLCPEFSEERFPGVASYNLGGMVDAEGRERPRREWTFQLIEAIHARAVDMLGGGERPYDMFGHSAGAQFVHRYVEFADCPHLRRAIAANAGWYTTLEEKVDFPFGLRNAPARVRFGDVAARDLVLLLGGDDVEETNLRTDDEANAQGATRLARGLNFYSLAHERAVSEGVSLAWTLQVVPGARHSNSQMAQAALPFLE